MQRPKVKAYVSNLKYVDGLEYLGAGYDVIKGNPLGSSDSLLDPGYRYPVITQKSANCPRNNSNCITVNSLLSIPMGVWVRRLSSCAKQERVRSLTQSNNTLDTKNIKNDLKFDVSIESPSPNDEHAFTAAFSFASSFSYDNLMKIATSRGHSIQQNMVYCYKYVTGYSLPVDKLSYSSEFAKFVKSLPVDFFAADCVASFYKTYPKSDNCKSVNSWMTLFNIFGTHFVTLVFLGGKIIINDTINTQQDIQNVKRNAQLNIDLNAKALDLSLDVGTSLSKNSNYTTSGATKSIYFLGGSVASPLDNFSAWSDSLSEHAMPVRITLQPLHLILPAQLTDSYNSAYQYYATLAPD